MQPPVPLADFHDLGAFDSGVASLDEWLRRRARANQAGGASRTYVVADGELVVGYYCLASGAIAAIDAPSAIRRNMPDPIPIALLGRLAIDRRQQGQGLGTALLQDAVMRTMRAAEIIGVRGLIVHALSDAAKAFYERYGFVASPTSPLTLALSLKRSGPG